MKVVEERVAKNYSVSQKGPRHYRL